ncbi:MAG: dsrM [Burkholderiaceae bacterium]|nr:dsrM [Burkholderiaceae bacterium]
MSAASIVFALLFYAATAVLVGGLAWRIADYARTPAPLKIPTTPAPITRGGVALRMAREVIFFESLFKGSLWTWLFGWLFHASLALVLARHLRYFTEPVWGWVVLVQPLGVLAAFGMLAGLAGLLARRVLVDRIRYISTPSDYLMLVLLGLIAVSGLLMKYVARTDVVAVKAYFLGLMRLDWQPLPADPVLYVHLGLVAALMIVFPYSKLLHAPGVFFSPSRNQVDNPREARHLSPWAARLDRS